MRSFRASILWRKKGLPQALTRQLTVRLLGSRAVFMPPTVKVREVPVDFCCCNRIGYLETAAQASVNCHKFFDTRKIYSQDFFALGIQKFPLSSSVQLFEGTCLTVSPCGGARCETE
jgi:hypothetical protein